MGLLPRLPEYWNRKVKFVLTMLPLLLASAANAQGTVLYPSKRLGGYQVQISTLDAQKSWISIQMMDRSGRLLAPGSVPLTADYAAKDIPFTPLPLEAKGSDIVGHVPVPEGQSYTLRLQVKSGRTTFNPRFFINRAPKTGN